MLFLRRLGLGLSVAILSLSLFSFAAAFSLYQVLGTPDSVKSALRGSGLYNVFVQDTIEEEQRGQGELATGSAKHDAAISQALLDAFPPAQVQQATEQSLDQTYDWAQGKTQQLVLKPDLSVPKNTFANRMAAYAQTEAAALPPCTSPVPAPTTLDELLAMTCLPPGISPQAIADTASQLALQSNIFDSLSLNTSEIKDDAGRPIDENLKTVPETYRYYTQSLYILPILALASGVAVIFWSATRRGGIRKLGHILLWTGVVSLVLAVLTNIGLNFVSEEAARNSSGVTTEIRGSFLHVVKELTADLRMWWVGIALAYAASGIILLIVVRVLNKRTARQREVQNESLGYSPTPRAGTTFDPDKKPLTGAEKPPAAKHKQSPGPK